MFILYSRMTMWHPQQLMANSVEYNTAFWSFSDISECECDFYITQVKCNSQCKQVQVLRRWALLLASPHRTNPRPHRRPLLPDHSRVRSNSLWPSSHSSPKGLRFVPVLNQHAIQKDLLFSSFNAYFNVLILPDSSVRIIEWNWLCFCRPKINWQKIK